jgi:hypothetical protein
MSSDDLRQRIEAIETGYEFMLAYAAQGRQTDKGGGSGSKVREHLNGMVAALDGLGAAATAAARAVDGELPKVGQAFFAAVESDAAIARAALRLVLARADISSQLIDNLNASIHLRALLTDLFVVDEALRPAPASA